jgi:hypothetical protein
MATKQFLAAKFRAFVGVNALVHGPTHVARMTASTNRFAHYWQDKLQDPQHFHTGRISRDPASRGCEDGLLHAQDHTAGEGIANLTESSSRPSKDCCSDYAMSGPG